MATCKTSHFITDAVELDQQTIGGNIGGMAGFNTKSQCAAISFLGLILYLDALIF